MSKKLKILREERALSLTDLSQISGVNRITTHRIETGKQRPMPRTIRKLAQALKVDVGELTGNKPASGSSRAKKPHKRGGA